MLIIIINLSIVVIIITTFIIIIIIAIIIENNGKKAIKPEKFFELFLYKSDETLEKNMHLPVFYSILRKETLKNE